MTLNDFQTQAMTFRMASADQQYALLNLAGEVGELLSLMAKARRDGISTEEQAEEFYRNIKKELGDILWQVAAVADDHGYTLDEIAEGNITKLSSRKARNKITGSGDNR